MQVGLSDTFAKLYYNYNSNTSVTDFTVLWLDKAVPSKYRTASLSIPGNWGFKDFKEECFAVQMGSELRVYHLLPASATIELIQSFASSQASNQVNVSDFCQMLRIDTSFYSSSNGLFSPVTMTNLSWNCSEVDQSLTLLVLSNGSVA